MKLVVQKRLAAEIMKCSQKRVWFDEEKLADIKEAITRADLKSLVNSGLIMEKPPKSISKVRTRARKLQKAKGRQKGAGRRKGKKTARLPKKTAWKNKIRVQRELLKSLRDKGNITSQVYQTLYSKSKGGFFRSKRHIKIFIKEQGLLTETKK
ncbi:50S ribosomal protein L19e [Candidatus Woesearchaeota archaeon]|nr:50S ribosomal protein L19e [Candidatus Woesearchaeota archaeon]